MAKSPASFASSSADPPAPLGESVPRPWDARLGRRLVAPLKDSWVTPNHLTTVRLALGLAGAAAFMPGTYGWTNLGALLVVLSNFLDHTDGELARISGRTSRIGHLYDLASDAAVTILLFVGIGIGVGATATRPMPLQLPAAGLGTAAGMAVALVFYLRMRIEETAGKTGTRQSSLGGFETEDVLYLLPLVTLLGGLAPFLIAAAVGAPLFAVLVLADFARMRHQSSAGARPPRETVPASGAQVPPALVPGAQIRWAEVPGAQIPAAQVPGAQIPPAQVPGAQIPAAQVRGAQVPGPLPLRDAPAAAAPTSAAPAAAEVERLMREALAGLPTAQLRSQYEAQGSFVYLERFLPPQLTAQLIGAVAAVDPVINRNYLPGHKQGGSVSRHGIDALAPLIAALYRSPALIAWLGTLTGERLQLSPADDPHAYAFYFYTRPGDHVGWHYDTSYYRGRRYTLLIGVIDRSSCRLDYELHTRSTDVATVPGFVQIAPGGLVLFDGDRLRHRITPMGVDEMRVSLTFEYVTDPRMSPWWRIISNMKDAVAYFGFRQVFRRVVRGRVDPT